MRVEPIRFWIETKSNFLNRSAALASPLEPLDFEIFENLQFDRVDSVSKGIDSYPLYTFLTELELQVESIRENREPRSRGACGANDSAYGDSGPSGVVSVCGVFVSTGRLIGPPGKYERWLSSASSGSVRLGYDNRPGELTMQVVTSSLAARLRPWRDRALIILSMYCISDRECLEGLVEYELESPRAYKVQALVGIQG
ncbi:hypothetical protein PIB30_096382 [Stylosanthes scabra]|uniref:Uncharacterized protein n=1 Tax=Stylosanthes scabra TaxID=79078 RepID=A0ABU6QVB5_9FABA|nr:hypothetical protein [Stylosanthes scabra]